MVIRASISLHADTTYVVPVAAVDYVDLVVSAELDTSGKFRAFIETAVVVDGVSFETTKPLADTTSAGDAVSVAALKNLADGFAMNDGSVYAFAKGISNVAFANDATTTAALKLLQDTQVMQDLVAKVLSRPIVDVFDMADDETVSALKGLSDSIEMQDSITTLLLFLRNFADDAAVADLRATLFTPATKTEQIAVADDDNIDYQKNLADGFAMNDGSEAVDGSQYSFSKGISNVTFVGDVSSLIFAAYRVESIAVPDVGLLSVQGYCDLSYFAEDYVGFSQSF
jgi:hypothetical protein